MKEYTIFGLVIILVILSIFIGFSINGNFAFVGEYAFISFPQQVISSWRGETERLTMLQYLHWILLTIAHILMLIMPFLYYRNKSSKVLVYIPMFYLLMQLWLLNIFGFILVPFIIVWIIILVLRKVSAMSKR